MQTFKCYTKQKTIFPKIHPPLLPAHLTTYTCVNIQHLGRLPSYTSSCVIWEIPGTVFWQGSLLSRNSISISDNPVFGTGTLDQAAMAQPSICGDTNDQFSELGQDRMIQYQQNFSSDGITVRVLLLHSSEFYLIEKVEKNI